MLLCSEPVDLDDDSRQRPPLLPPPLVVVAHGLSNHRLPPRRPTTPPSTMDPSWQQSYPDSAGASRRHNGTGQMHGQPPLPGASPYGYDHTRAPQYHGGAPLHAAAPGQTHSIAHHGANPAISPQMAPGHGLRDGNGDIPMHDAHDAHAGIKYPMRPHHQSHASGGRPSNLQSPHEQPPSAAAQRYSPMDTLSPTSPYAPKTSQFAHPPSQMQSPGGQAEYAQSPYYGGRPSAGQHLPPIAPFAASNDGYPSATVANLDGAYPNGPKSPLRQNPPAPKTVPEFRKVRALTDLRPKNSRQPPFRRANPEGGFISVSFTD